MKRVGLRFWAFLLVAVLLVLPVTASANHGEDYFHRTWLWGDKDTGAFGFQAGLSAAQVQDVITEMDDLGLASGTAGAATQLVKALDIFGPMAAAVTVAVGLGDYALRRCSNDGKRGVVISGISFTQHKGYIENYDPAAPDTDYVVRVYVPYWCKAQ